MIKIDIVKICAGLIIVLALLMCSSVATETTWRHSGFELWGYDINCTDHNLSNVQYIDAENITSEKIGSVIYADQYTTIQDAINASDSDNDGYADFAVFLPCGTYEVSGSPIYLINNSELYGCGDCSKIILAGSQTFSWVNDRGTIYSMISNTNLVNTGRLDKNIYIHDLLIDGNGSYQSNHYNAITLGNTENVLIENVHIQNTYGFCVGSLGAGSVFPDGIKIIDSIFEKVNASLPERDLIAIEASNDFIFTGNTLLNYNGSGITSAYCKNANIYNNYINSTVFGVDIEGPTTSESILISNNFIKSEGIILSYVDGVKISSNYIEGLASSNAGIQVDRDSERVQILDNSITNYNHGVYYANASFGYTSHTIYNNIIYRNRYSGFRIENNSIATNFSICNNLLDSNNLVNDSSFGAMRISLRYSTISGNLFKNNSQHNIAQIAGITKSNLIYNNVFRGGSLTLYGSSLSTLWQNRGISPFYFGTNATAPTAYGAGDEYYNSTDNIKYCYDGSAWVDLSSGGVQKYGEAYIYNNAVDTVIETANTPIALRQIGVGLLSGWTFDAGSTGGITEYADEGGYVRVMSASHGLSNGDFITIRGTTNYNGVFTISGVAPNDFRIVDTWVNDNGASDWDQGASLTAGANSAGKYTVRWQMSSAPDAAMTCTWVIYMNGVAQTKTTGERKFAQNEYGCCTSMGILDISAGDVIWLTIQSDGTQNILNKHGNFNVRTI